MDRRCPACAQHDLTPLAHLGEAPVACGLTFPTAAAARISPRGQILLESCPGCGHVANTRFDQKLIRFDSSYEAALFHSPTYAAYAVGQVERLVKQHDLAGGKVLEVGSGDPTLLNRLTELGCGATGLPGLPTDKTKGSYDLALARFVLEHVTDPATLLKQLRAVARRAFIEVPDAAYDLGTAGWDCIYPHVGYFGESSLLAVLSRTGWTVLDSGTGFSGQYRWVEVEAGPSTPPSAQPSAATAEHAGFAERYQQAKTHWQDQLSTRVTSAPAVVWGAGTRGTMFCNRVDPRAQLVAGVVDRNPSKHGRYLPITGHRVLSPAELAHLKPGAVVLTNPHYRDEIAAELASLGVAAEILIA